MISLPNPKWAPLYYTPPLTQRTRGDDVVDFGELTMRATRGMRENEPIIFTEWQRWLLANIFQEKDDGLLLMRNCLIGLPRKQGKSMLGTAIALQRLFYGNAGTEIYSAAADRAQAKIVFGDAKKQIAQSRILSSRLISYRDHILNKQTGAIYRALSADGMSAQGLAPELVIADELTAWKDGKGDEMWSAINDGSGDRPESLVIAITTATDRPDSLLGKQFKRGKSIADFRNGISSIEEGGIDDPTFGFFWWAAPEEADPFLPETWALANPNLAEGLMDLDYLEARVREAKAVNLLPFKRFNLNQPVRSDGKTMYLSASQWAAAKNTELKVIPRGAKIALGFDGSINDDSTVFTAIDIETGLTELLAIWEKEKGNPDWTVPRDEVNAAKIRIFETYDVVKFWVDSAFWQTDVEEWAKGDRKRIIESIPGSIQRMRPLTEQLKLDIVNSEVTHNGNLILEKHALAAVQENNGKVAKDGRESPRKIDALMGMILANGARRSYLKKGSSKITVLGSSNWR